MSPQTPPLLEPYTLAPSGDKIKRYCQRAKTTEISTSGIDIVSMQQGHSRQCRTIGFFPATADLVIVIILAPASTKPTG